MINNVIGENNRNDEEVLTEEVERIMSIFSNQFVIDESSNQL